MTPDNRKLSMRTIAWLATMALLTVTTPVMSDSIVVCPPHDGDFSSEPVIQDTDTQTIDRIHNQQTRAVAIRGCRRCGDGIVQTDLAEQCDTAGQSATCDVDCTNVFCGDGVVNTAAGEECDDGNTQSGDGCSSVCTTEVPIVCGNGVLQAGEECDDGNTDDNDFCTNSCKHATCGDGITCSACGEQCDGGGQTATCDADCTLVECGDGVVNTAAGEECDPPGDGCDTNCKIAQQQQCNPPQVDCNGVCVDTQTDPNNCGSCGIVCAFPNATTGCASGQCTITSCNSGWYNADGIVTNGCEQPVAAQGSACTSSNQCASGNCVDGYCCNSACGGTGQCCNLSGAQGTCSTDPMCGP